MSREYDFTDGERGKYFGGFIGEELAAMRTDVARGAGHDCGEWVLDGRCLLCDRWIRPENLQRFLDNVIVPALIKRLRGDV